MDVIVCLAKAVGPEGQVDCVLQGRLDTAINLAKQYPEAKLMLSGGRGITDPVREDRVTEAEAMKDYVLKRGEVAEERIIVESESEGSQEQLVIIVDDYLKKNNWNEVTIVTDELHMPRIRLILDWITTGSQIKPTYISCPVNLYGKYRQLIEEFSENMLENTRETLRDIPKGDPQALLKQYQAYKQLRRLRMERGVSNLDEITIKDVEAFEETGSDPKS